MTPDQFHTLLGCLFIIGALICPHRNSLRTGFLAGCSAAQFLLTILSKF